MLWSILKVIFFYLSYLYNLFLFCFFSFSVGQVISQDFFSACVFFLFWFYLGLKLCLACQFTVHFEYSYFAHEIRFTQLQVIRVFGRPLTLNSVEVSVWHLLIMKRFWFFIVLQLIANCSRVFSDTKTLTTPGLLPRFYSHGWLTQTCPAI